MFDSIMISGFFGTAAGNSNKNSSPMVAAFEYWLYFTATPFLTSSPVTLLPDAMARTAHFALRDKVSERTLNMVKAVTYTASLASICYPNPFSWMSVAALTTSVASPLAENVGLRIGQARKQAYDQRLLQTEGQKLQIREKAVQLRNYQLNTKTEELQKERDTLNQNIEELQQEKETLKGNKHDVLAQLKENQALLKQIRQAQEELQREKREHHISCRIFDVESNKESGTFLNLHAQLVGKNAETVEAAVQDFSTRNIFNTADELNEYCRRFRLIHEISSGEKTLDACLASIEHDTEEQYVETGQDKYAVMRMICARHGTPEDYIALVKDHEERHLIGDIDDATKELKSINPKLHYLFKGWDGAADHIARLKNLVDELEKVTYVFEDASSEPLAQPRELVA